MIDARSGWKVENVEERYNKSMTKAISLKIAMSTESNSDDVVGCGGASSTVGGSLKMPLDGGHI
jgi:hypothetical protein